MKEFNRWWSLNKERVVDGLVEIYTKVTLSRMDPRLLGTVFIIIIIIIIF